MLTIQNGQTHDIIVQYHMFEKKTLCQFVAKKVRSGTHENKFTNVFAQCFRKGHQEKAENQSNNKQLSSKA